MESGGKENSELSAKSITERMLKGVDKNQDPGLVSPLLLAFIGDSVYDICIRTALVKQGNRQVQKVHARATDFVSAKAQSEAVSRLKNIFTEEELNIFKRGRNAKFHTKAKNASTVEYKAATGFEAVFGYLFLKGDAERILKLAEVAVDGTLLDIATEQ